MAGVTLKFDTKRFESEMKSEYESKLQKVDALMGQELRKAEIDAVGRVPEDEGFLRGEIGVTGKDLNYEFVSGAFYSVYMEFGTGTQVRVPAGYEVMALETANAAKATNKGDFVDFAFKILDWMKRKNIGAGQFSVKTRRRVGNQAQKADEDLKLATAIVYSILKKGIKPKPFMIPAWEKFVEQFTTKLNNIK